MYPSIRRSILVAASLLTVGVAAGSAHADSPVLGAVLGGGTGAWVGSSLGGRDGAIIGGALGAAAGVVVASDYRRTPTYYYAPQPVYRYAPPAVVYAAPVYYPPYERGWRHHERDHHRHDRGHHHGYQDDYYGDRHQRHR
jgi:hypothetical protein